jgi:hypothetical protein
LACSAVPVTAHAEDCRQYLRASVRADCRARNHPELWSKCHEEGLKMGLFESGGRARVGGLRPYIAACMRRAQVHSASRSQ